MTYFVTASEEIRPVVADRDETASDQVSFCSKSKMHLLEEKRQRGKERLERRGSPSS